MHTSLGTASSMTVVQQTVQGIRFVPFPTAPNSPGRQGDRAQMPNYIAYYDGDGVNNHSWQFTAVEPLTSDFFN